MKRKAAQSDAALDALADKVKSGQPLTSAELRALKDSTNPEGIAKNQSALARILGVNRKTIQRRSKEPGAPIASPNGSQDVSAWRRFLAGEHTQSAQGIEPDDLESQTVLKARQILLQNQKLEFQISVMRREFVPVEDVQQWGADLGTSVRKALVQIPRLSASLSGLPADAIELRLKEAIDEAFASIGRLGEKIEDWKNTVEREN